MKEEDADFSGYATRTGLKCTDGRTITPEAFKHMDGVTVPLVWQHRHDSPDNVLGHAVLKVVGDGVRAYGFFNKTVRGEHTKALVLHNDIKFLSIYANQIVEKMINGGKQVLHGMIREVSLVLAGANPGAVIDFVRVQHGDGEVWELEDEAVIHTGIPIEIVEHKEEKETSKEKVTDEVTHATVRDIYDTLTEEQKNFVHYMVGVALEKADGVQQSDDSDENLEHQEGSTEMSRNVFEQNEGTTTTKDPNRHVLSHSDVKGIVSDAVKRGSLKEAVEAYALAHGVEDIGTLFPDPKTLTDRPEWNKRRTEWVAGVINGVRRSPFSRVKSIVADLTQEEARAKGYITGTYKKEQWFGLTSRVTTPTTVYKKQKIDRDDIVDITDFDVVAWLKGELRLMLEEEVARAILIGDGRDPEDEDKIKDPGDAAEGAGIRSIANENELYATQVYVNLDDASSNYTEIVEALLRSREHYQGSGTPTLYTTQAFLVEMLLLKDTLGRRLYSTKAELAAALMVDDIVTVDVMNGETEVLAVIVNLADYNVGADRGGEVNMFDDFDIDYNQYKYLIETRVSGALVKIKSALVIRKTASGNVLALPAKPTFVADTGVVTIPTVTGVVYKNADSNATLTAGAQTALDPGDTLKVKAVPASGYYFLNTMVDGPWSFKRPSA